MFQAGWAAACMLAEWEVIRRTGPDPVLEGVAHPAAGGYGHGLDLSMLETCQTSIAAQCMLAKRGPRLDIILC